MHIIVKIIIFVIAAFFFLGLIIQIFTGAYIIYNYGYKVYLVSIDVNTVSLSFITPGVTTKKEVYQSLGLPTGFMIQTYYDDSQYKGNYSKIKEIVYKIQSYFDYSQYTKIKEIAYWTKVNSSFWIWHDTVEIKVIFDSEGKVYEFYFYNVH